MLKVSKSKNLVKLYRSTVLAILLLMVILLILPQFAAVSHAVDRRSSVAPHVELAQRIFASRAVPAIPTVPTVPPVPTVPTVPTVPPVPTVPTVPPVPTAPTAPTVPSPSATVPPTPTPTVTPTPTKSPTPVSVGRIHGVLWLDANKDGIHDPNEQLAAGVVVILRDANGKEIARTTTGSDGSYSFANLPFGTYQLEFIPPTGMQLATPGTLTVHLDAAELGVSDLPLILLPTGLDQASEPQVGLNQLFIPLIRR